jgi:hypothetical protein
MIQTDQLPLNETHFRIAHQLAKFVLMFAFFTMSACSLTVPGQQVHRKVIRFRAKFPPQQFRLRHPGG